MTDSIAVFDPGYRVLNSSGAVVSGAKLKFFDAGTTTPKTVYADKDLVTAIGTTVTCDSAGYPTSDGASTKTQVFTGTANYKLRITTSADVTISEHDNCKGALDTSDFGGGEASTFATPVLTKSSNYTVLTDDQSTLFDVACSGGDVTMTLPSAVTAGDGFRVGFRHAGTANQVIIATVSSQTISHGTTTGTNMSLVGIGEAVWIVSNGANWLVDTYAPPYLKATMGVIVVSDIANSPPGSPVQGERCIVGGTPADGFSTFAQHDVAEYTGNAWLKLTPPTDCGWLAYVQDEDAYYQFTGSAWVSGATTSRYGDVKLADQAAMEALTASRAVSADVQHYHPGMLKAWVKFAGSSTINADYGVSSITDNGLGDYTANWDVVFSSAHYSASGICTSTTSNDTGFVMITTMAAGSLRVGLGNDDGAAGDANPVTLQCAGDQ